MKIPFKRLFSLSHGRSKGVTLPEVLVAVSIFSVIVVPFLGTFLSASNNNVVSKDILYSSIISQKAMDDIKARPLLLTDKAGKPAELYESEGLYKVYYKIDGIKTDELPEGTNEFDFDLYSKNICQEFVVEGSTVKLNGFSYSLVNGGVPEKYQLYISKSSDGYNYIFKKGGIFQNDGLITPDTEINEKISFIGGGTDKFELHVTVDDTVDKNVNFYIVDDDNSRLILVNDGNKSFNRYMYAVSDQVNYSDSLYKIEVTVYKGPDVINRLISYVNK
ncbi:type IV pilus modification PilV family protein [Pseudobacteroides cellulosolvens]|uniref:Prepilin-type N-terminal cleavage/methylation domain-containing protein n=1 Tax=Pseudobacteroides cellulosolvens ATCC 35603 = DSM 2933 TaxID=398512 RepID=A0A0L6JLS3_9FIRM|nr:prepilin-type N-terminal cleavage/methylation domain-containing protein [Pseudobacteroides cellulosolvens]KNY26704.1 hypothetical protein Bccel_1969 [Pseudobacteroides cellulosolvens ATCC 35603 = DSM 2933]